MRFIPVDSVSFTTINDKSVEIKDMREYSDQQLKQHLKVKEEDRVDEIASRETIYGEEAENQAYKIVDMNIVKMFESDFTFNNVNSIDIPL